MKKIVTSTVAALAVMTSVHAAEDLSSMFSEAKASGQIRYFGIDREYQGTAGKDTHRNANAIGGHLKFETADFHGLNGGVAFYTTNGMFLKSPYDDYSQNDMTLLGPNNENYSMIGELFLQYKRGNTTFKGGRQKLNTPMAGADDARMVPNLFEAYLLSNTDLPGTTLIAGHVTRFAQGTFGRVYDASANVPNAILSATSGYSAVDSRNQVGKFVSMGQYAVGEETDGVSVLSATYSGVKNLKLQLWDYYAYDLMNIIYGQADFSWNCLLNDNVKPYVAGQFIKENSMGEEYAGEVDSLYWAVKAGAKVENFNAYLAYSQTSENDTAADGLKNAIVTPWGGMPAFTQGMVTRHMFIAGTKAMKAAASYNWKSFGPNFKTVGYYTSFDMDANSGYGIERTATEAGFDLIYYPALVKNLQLRARGNFPRDFYEGDAGTVGWSEYRFIANYNF